MTTKATKSPSAPSRPLGSCFDDAMRVYSAYPNAAFDSSEVASCLGLSSASGAFKSLMSDLKQYGLISKSGDAGEFVISQDLKDLGIVGEDDKAQIKYSLATHPKVFLQIIETQGHHVPDADILSNLLVARFGFNTAKSLKTAKALRGSLAWAECIDGKGNVTPPRPQSEAAVQDEPEERAEEAPINPISERPSSFQREDALKQATGTLSADVPIGEGRVVHVVYPLDLTEKEAKKVGAVLAVLTEMPE